MTLFYLPGGFGSLKTSMKILEKIFSLQMNSLVGGKFKGWKRNKTLDFFRWAP